MKTMVKFNDDYSNRDRNYFRDAIWFYQDLTNFDKLDGTVYISFTDTVPATSMPIDATFSMGLMVCKIKDQYLVYINSEADSDEQLKTLFHELCHVNQYSSGKQKIDHLGRIIWNNSTPYPNTKQYTYEAYQSLPWEIEAREHEELYFDLWQKEQKYTLKNICRKTMAAIFG